MQTFDVQVEFLVQVWQGLVDFVDILPLVSRLDVNRWYIVPVSASSSIGYNSIDMSATAKPALL